MSKLGSLITLSLVIAALMLPPVVVAQTDAEPVARAVLFYSPSCPHCHDVINELLLPMLEEHGDRLQIAGIDTSQPAGSQLYQAAADTFQIPNEQRGVPLLVVGDTYLVGSTDIPAQFPGIVEAGLAGDGIPWPDFPGMAEVAAQIEAENATAPTPAPATGAADIPQPGDDTGVCRPGEDCEGTETPDGVVPDAMGPEPPPAVSARLTGDGVVRLVFFLSDT